MDEVKELGLPFDFFYLPAARKTTGNLGYAFINFLNHDLAIEFLTVFQNATFKIESNSKKRAQTSFATLQGFQANAAFYSNAKVAKTKYRPFIAI
jgi:RNA recognition motif-containing protein